MPELRTVRSSVGSSPDTTKFFDETRVQGTFDVNIGNSGTATTSNVSASASSTTVLAANTERRGFTVYNDSEFYLYLKAGATAATTDFTVKLPPGAFYELLGPFIYTGIWDGIWNVAGGTARVTEFT